MIPTVTAITNRKVNFYKKSNVVNENYDNNVSSSKKPNYGYSDKDSTEISEEITNRNPEIGYLINPQRIQNNGSGDRLQDSRSPKNSGSVQVSFNKKT